MKKGLHIISILLIIRIVLVLLASIKIHPTGNVVSENLVESSKVNFYVGGMKVAEKISNDEVTDELHYVVNDNKGSPSGFIKLFKPNISLCFVD